MAKARYYLGAEESLERKYRLESSPEVRLLYDNAAASLLVSLGEARALGADPTPIEDVFTRHRDYLAAIDRMFAAIDAGYMTLAFQIVIRRGKGTPLAG